MREISYLCKNDNYGSEAIIQQPAPLHQGLPRECALRILSNNCATAVAKSLNKAGIITYMGNNNPIWTIKLNSYIPSRLFNDIVKHNSNGKYIYK